MEELAEGLWRWVEAHPGWKPENDTPSGWKQDVASIAFRSPDGPIVLVDPLIRDEEIWRWLERQGDIVIVHGNRYHRRSTDEVVRRTGARVVAAGGSLPAGIEALPIAGLGGEETAYFLHGPRALVLADAVIGAGRAEVRLAPLSWSEDKELYARVFRAEMARLAARRIDLLLTSHGKPVFAAGGPVLRHAVELPAWGEAAATS